MGISQEQASSLETYDQVPWYAAKVSFAPQQSQVRDLLKDFAASQHLPVSISDAVKGVISGLFADIPPAEFLNAICEAHDLLWFYDGLKINIEGVDEIVSRTLSLSYVTPEVINDVLFTIGYASGPQGRESVVKKGHRTGIVLLVGGPQFVQAMDALVKDLELQESKRQNEQIAVKAFRLKYANASDTYLPVNTGSGIRNVNTVIPGIARSLQNLMTNQAPGGEMYAGLPPTNTRPSHQGLMGQGLSAIGNSNANQRDGYNPFAPNIGQQQQAGGGVQQQERPQAVDPQDPRSPMIVADSRLNAVMVRDVASRMPLYEELIKMLDVPTRAIEISAAIVDIDTNNARDLGLELLGGNGNGSSRIGFDADRGLFDGVNTQGQNSSFKDGSDLVRGVGLNLSSLVAYKGYDLLARLRAVEQAGAGQVLSSPSVFTLENVQAVIKTEEKVYVRVQGNMATDLYDVSTGVQLRVTPTIITEGGRTDFKLVIDITDGSFNDTQVDNIPSTRESAINTQALVPEDKTLLLGGYTVERRTKSDSNVPLLHKVPILGKVFSRTERNHQRRQRFFFITPRLVDLSREATDPGKYVEGWNSLEINPRLPDENLTRETPEAMARRMAASTARLQNLYRQRDGAPPAGIPLVDPTNTPKNLRQPVTRK